MLALRVSESVLRKYLDDDGAFWLQLDLSNKRVQGTDIIPEEEVSLDGLVWSPKPKKFFRIGMSIKGKLWHGTFFLYGVGVWFEDGKSSQRSASYLLTHEDDEGLEVNRLEFPNGSLPGLSSPGYEIV